MDPKILETVILIAFLILSLGIHEAAHAWVAHLCGDSTAKDMGRMTVNPIPHIDPIMTILVPAVLYMTRGFMFGGAKPVPVNINNLRHPLRDMMFVALAGPLSNLVLALLFGLAWKTAYFLGGYTPDTLLFRVLQYGAYFNLILAVFNMLPVPPLDGSRVMTFLLPSGLREQYAYFERFGLVLIIVLLYVVPGTMRLIQSTVNWLWLLIYDVTGGAWA